MAFTIAPTSVGTLPLRMSSNFDEDELSKLLNKRKSIKKPSGSPSSDEILSSLEDVDLNKMPELKTRRPTRKFTPPKDEDSISKVGGRDEKKNAAIDYLADFEDENDFHIPNRVGFGTGGWGDDASGFVSEGKLSKRMRKEGKYVPGDLQVAYNTLLEGGISFLDTSEAYGSKYRKSELSAEHILARCIEENRDYEPALASTFANPWLRPGSKSVFNALKASCDRMGQSSVELYQVRGVNLLYPGGRNFVADGLALALDEGYCNYVGICNAGKLVMKRMAKKLEKRECSLTSNQFAFSLTNRKAWKSGLIDACKDLGVIPLAHSPLDGGLSTGIFTATNPSGGQAGGQAKYNFKTLEKLQHLHETQETVATRVKTRLEREKRNVDDRYSERKYGPSPKINTDITTTQIAINYVVAKGAVPLPGINTPKQAEELLGCIGWSLTEEEVDMLDNAADLCDL